MEKFPNKNTKQFGINVIRILGTYMKETVDIFLRLYKEVWIHGKLYLGSLVRRLNIIMSNVPK